MPKGQAAAAVTMSNSRTKVRTHKSPRKEPQESVDFADSKAKVAWKIGREVSRISAEFPAEDPQQEAKKIQFDADHATRGTYAILMAGTVVGTEQQGVFVVPNRTLAMLNRLGIQYHTL